MKSEEILNYCLENLKGTVFVNSWGEKGVFYNPDKSLKRGIYILTIKEKDGENDKSSKLDRDGIYRVNLGVRKENFTKCSAQYQNALQKAVLWIWIMISAKQIKLFRIPCMRG